jgi:hypothetical protein
MLLSRRHHRRPLMKNQSHGKVVTLFYLELHEFQCLASTLSCIRVLCVDKSFSPTWRQQSFSPQSVSYDSAPVSNFFAIFHETFSNKSRTTIVYTQVTRERPFLLTVFASNPYLYCNKAYTTILILSWIRCSDTIDFPFRQTKMLKALSHKTRVLSFNKLSLSVSMAKA